MTLLPWRRKIESWLGRTRQDRDINQLIYWLSRLERRMDDMDEKMDSVSKHVDDVVAYAASVVDAVKKALDYLRAHQGDDAAAKEFSDHVDAKMKELEDKLHEVNASGGVA